MVEVRLGVLTLLTASALFATGCSSTSAEAVAPSTLAPTAQSSTSEQATNSTIAATTTTDSEQAVTDSYCVVSRQNTVNSAQYLIDNGAEANASVEFAELAVIAIEKQVSVPETIRSDYALVRDALIAYRDARAGSDSALTNDELLEVWTPESRAAAAVVNSFDQDVCGFDPDEIAAELR